MSSPVGAHPFFGPAAPELGWVPAPRYLLRRQRILACLQGVEPCPLVEVGPGAGALLAELARRGFDATGLEPSAEARGLAERFLADLPNARVVAAPQPGWQSAFGLVLAFEVLEHIEDDAAALAQWRGWLAPGGRLLASVPAHRRKWSVHDEWAGHVRRYERRDLARLAHGAGLEVERLECYGFPLGNLVRPLRILAARRARRRDAAGGAWAGRRGERTAQSGTERGLESRLFPLQASLPGRLALGLAFRLQERFLSRDLGVGYLMVCRAP